MPSFASNPRFSRATKWRGEVAHVKAIHPDGACDKFVADSFGFFLVFGKNHCGESVFGVVGERNQFGFAGEFLQCQHWTKHFLPENLRTVWDVGEQCRFKIQMSKFWCNLATKLEFCLSLKCTVHKALHPLEVRAGHERTDDGAGISRVALLGVVYGFTQFC